MAKGPDDFADGWVDGKVAVSGYVLSASVAYSPPHPFSQLTVNNIDVLNSHMHARTFGESYSRLCRYIRAFIFYVVLVGWVQAFNSSSKHAHARRSTRLFVILA